MREKERHEIEVHVAGLCFREKDGALQCLIGRRAETRALYPDLWECGGGQVRHGESFEAATQRQMKEEFGLTVDILSCLGSYFIPAAGIPGVKMLCRMKQEQDVQIDNQEIVAFAWIEEKDIPSYDFIPHVAQDITRGFQKMKTKAA